MNLIQWLRADDAIDDAHTSDQHLQEEKLRLRNLCQNFGLQQNGALVDFLVTETKGRVTAVQDAMKGLETKAAAQIAVLATIMGALAIFGPAGSNRDGPTLWIYGALFFTALAFAFDIAVLAPYGSQAPSLEEYATDDSLTAPQSAACLKAEYAVRTLIYARRLARPNTRKGRWLSLSMIALMLALSLLIINYITQQSSTSATSYNQFKSIKLTLTPSAGTAASNGSSLTIDLSHANVALLLPAKIGFDLGPHFHLGVRGQRDGGENGATTIVSVNGLCCCPAATPTAQSTRRHCKRTRTH